MENKYPMPYDPTWYQAVADTAVGLLKKIAGGVSQYLRLDLPEMTVVQKRFGMMDWLWRYAREREYYTRLEYSQAEDMVEAADADYREQYLQLGDKRNDSTVVEQLQETVYAAVVEYLSHEIIKVLYRIGHARGAVKESTTMVTPILTESNLCDTLQFLNEALSKPEQKEYDTLNKWWDDAKPYVRASIVADVEKTLKQFMFELTTTPQYRHENSRDYYQREIIRALQRARTQIEIELVIMAANTPGEKGHRTFLHNIQKRLKDEQNRYVDLRQLEADWQETYSQAKSKLAPDVIPDAIFFANITRSFKKRIGLNEDCLNENLFFSGEDIAYNFAQFINSKDGKLFVTGYTGSGKSTTARDIARQYGAQYIGLDSYIPIDREYVDKQREIYTEESIRQLREYFQQMVDVTLDEIQNLPGKCVVEGIQVFIYSRPERLKEHSVLVKGTSALLSFLRAFFRNRKSEWAQKWSYWEIVCDIYHNLMPKLVERFARMVTQWKTEQAAVIATNEAVVVDLDELHFKTTPYTDELSAKKTKMRDWLRRNLAPEKYDALNQKLRAELAVFTTKFQAVEKKADKDWRGYTSDTAKPELDAIGKAWAEKEYEMIKAVYDKAPKKNKVKEDCEFDTGMELDEGADLLTEGMWQSIKKFLGSFDAERLNQKRKRLLMWFEDHADVIGQGKVKQIKDHDKEIFMRTRSQREASLKRQWRGKEATDEYQYQLGRIFTAAVKAEVMYLEKQQEYYRSIIAAKEKRDKPDESRLCLDVDFLNEDFSWKGIKDAVKDKAQKVLKHIKSWLSSPDPKKKNFAKEETEKWKQIAQEAQRQRDEAQRQIADYAKRDDISIEQAEEEHEDLLDKVLIWIEGAAENRANAYDRVIGRLMGGMASHSTQSKQAPNYRAQYARSYESQGHLQVGFDALCEEVTYVKDVLPSIIRWLRQQLIGAKTALLPINALQQRFAIEEFLENMTPTYLPKDRLHTVKDYLKKIDIEFAYLYYNTVRQIGLEDTMLKKGAIQDAFYRSRLDPLLQASWIAMKNRGDDTLTIAGVLEGFGFSADRDIDMYLKDMPTGDLLSAGKEHELAVLAQKGDKAARAALIEGNLRLVVHIAKKWVHCGLPLQDLIQEGNIGLMLAVDKFKPELGFRFSTYATSWIIKTLHIAVQNYTRLSRHGIRTASLPDIPESVCPICQRKSRQLQNVLALLEAIGDPIKKDYAAFQDKLDPGEMSDLLKSTLDDKTANMMRMRFGMGGYKPMTLEEIGREVGLSRERVRQILAAALLKLRDKLTNESYQTCMNCLTLVEAHTDTVILREPSYA